MFGLTTTKKLEEAKAKNVEFYQTGLRDGKAFKVETDVAINVVLNKLLGLVEESRKLLISNYNKGLLKGSEEATKNAVDAIFATLDIKDLLTKRFLDVINALYDSVAWTHLEFTTEVNDSHHKLRDIHQKMVEEVQAQKTDFNNYVVKIKKTMSEAQTALSKSHTEFNNIVSEAHKVFKSAMDDNRVVIGQDRAAAQKAANELEKQLKRVVDAAADFDIDGLFTSKVKQTSDDIEKALKASNKLYTDETMQHMRELLEHLKKAIEDTHKAAAKEGIYRGAEAAIEHAVNQLLHLLDVRTLHRLAQEKDNEERS
jgi:hypothetical protein